MRFYHAAKEDPAIEEEGRAWFRRLEEGDPEARKLWAWIREVSLTSLYQTLRLLGVTFDDDNGEAFYADQNQAVEAAREARLGLVAAAGLTLRRGLWALELEAPPMRAD